MDKPETPAVNSDLPEDFPQIEEVDARSDEKVAVYGGEIVSWSMLGYTHVSCWWPSKANAVFLIFFL